MRAVDANAVDIIAAEDAHAARVAERLADAAMRAKMRARDLPAPARVAPSDASASARARRDGDDARRAREVDALTRERDALAVALVEQRRLRAEAERARARLATRSRRQEAEVAKLRDALREARSSTLGASTSGAAARTRTVEPARMLGDGTPETVSFEYHVAATEALDRKVRALVDEIEELRRSKGYVYPRGGGGTRRDLEPVATDERAATTDEPTTPRPGGARASFDANDAPFSPTMSPLDALLARIARIDGHTDGHATRRREVDSHP